MEILGLIPARGGSKGIPQKNIAPLCGRPLLAYTCDSALMSRRLTRIVLDTDDPSIAEIGGKYGVEVPFLRPAELAQDDTLILDVLCYTLRRFADEEDYHPEIVVLLQTTSPFRRSEHIDTAVDILIENNADSVVSVIEVHHRFNPASLMRLEADGRLVPFLLQETVTRRQDKPRIYARNGPVILAMHRRTILEKHSLYGDDCRAYLMREEDSLDIDTPLDLEMAAFLMKRREKQVNP